jgi:hypothetical protein
MEGIGLMLERTRLMCGRRRYLLLRYEMLVFGG